MPDVRALGGPTQPGDGARSRAVLPAGIAAGFPARRRRRRPLRAPRAVRRRRERRFRRGIPERLVADRRRGPVFKIVTGVSTGALMAPFAFLGPSYDAALREFYTTTSSRDIFIVGSMLDLGARAAAGDSLADTGPLAALIARHVDAEFLRRRSPTRTARAAALHRHRRPRFPALRRVEHGADRRAAAARRRWISSARSCSRPRPSRSPFRRCSSRSRPTGGATTRCTSTAAWARDVFLHGGVFSPSLIRERGGRRRQDAKTSS